MRVACCQGLVAGLAVVVTAFPGAANRLTFEVWTDSSPDHVTSCTLALTDGWISLVQVQGAGLPGPNPMRWRASDAEIAALASSLQAFVGGELGAIDPIHSRQPAAPFLSVTWMTRLDDRLATGFYLQSGLVLPGPLSESVASLGLGRACGLSAKVGE